MGAPNVMRGASHSGNVSARTLAADGLLDILSSDYIPFSLIQSAFFLGEAVGGNHPAAGGRHGVEEPGRGGRA